MNMFGNLWGKVWSYEKISILIHLLINGSPLLKMLFFIIKVKI